MGKNRHGVFFVRASKPDDSGRRKVYQLSLGTKDPKIARILALRFCLNLAENVAMIDPREFMGRYEVNVATGTVKTDGTQDDHDRAMQALFAMSGAHVRIGSMQRTVPAPVPLVATLSNAAPLSQGTAALFNLKAALDAHYAEEVAIPLADRTLGEKRVLFNEFLECFGDVPLSEITAPEVVSRWRPLERKRLNKKKKQGETLSAGRLEKRRTYLSKFFTWVTDGGFYPHKESPVAMKMATKKAIKAQTRSYVEFNSDDLKLLFRAEYAQAMDKPDFYWLPLLAMFSGARLGEIANLMLEDVEEVEGIKVYEICKGKTLESQRTVPIHSQLLELGFWEYVQSLKAKKLTHVVPFRPLDSLGGRAGETWSAWVKSSGITNDRKVFHSFRSTAITDMHNGPSGEAPIRGVVGHTDTSSTDVHNQYIRGIRLINVKKVIETLSFPTVNFQAIKREDPTFSEFIDARIADANDPVKAAKAARIKENRIKRAEMDKRLGSSRKPRTTTAAPLKTSIFKKKETLKNGLEGVRSFV
jgi:integrase